MTWWLTASIAFWLAAMGLLAYMLWRTSAKRTWRRMCPTFVDWVAACVNNQSPPSMPASELEKTVTLLLDDVVPDKRPATVAGQKAAQRWA